MQDLRTEIATTAPTDMTVVIEGERGTGKELVAREIHLQSSRARGLCPGELRQFAELTRRNRALRCERGAFTGAEFRKGRFEQAHTGTLLLDEIENSA